MDLLTKFLGICQFPATLVGRAFVHAGKVSSAWWFATYFLSIPFFALVYSVAFPNSFKHATLADEPATREERRQLAKDIRLCLILQNDAANNFIAEWEEKRVWMNTIGFSLDDATADEQEIHFSISCDCYELPPGGPAFPTKVDRVTFRLAMPITPDAEDDELSYRKVRIINPGDSPIPYFLLFRHKFSNKRFDGTEPYWGIWKWQSHLLVRHAFYLRGLTGSSDDFPTLLYFSAVTISTLGFGDIVPITRLARLAVGFEATWGIFVAGLFLNSLAREIAPAKSLKSHDCEE